MTALLPTPRQAEVLAELRRFTEEHGMPPTLRELGVALGIQSTNSISGHLHALHRCGLVRKAAGRSRGWRPA